MSVAGASSGGALPNVAVSNAPQTTAGGGVGGYLNQQKDATESSTEAKFGEVYKNIQAKYGAKPEKPREVKKTLGKDDFLKIMITQMRNQDPTNPFKAEQMATEMAQFTTVEQMQNMNSNLQKMSTQNQPLERLAMTGLIGKTITVDRDRFPHTEGNNEALSFTLPKNAAEVKIALINQTGETVLEKDLGPMKTGEQTFTWDGKKVNTLPAKAGNYMFRIEAKDERGQIIQTNPMKTARVVGVSFEGQEPVLLVGDNKNQERVLMKSVVRIDGDAPPLTAGMAPRSQFIPAPPGMGAAPGGSAIADGGPGTTGAPNAPAGAGKFFTFQKGQGSQNADLSSMDPEAAAAIIKAQTEGDPDSIAKNAANPQAALESLNAANAANAAKAAKMAEADSNEKGFANGINEGREAPEANSANSSASQGTPNGDTIKKAFAGQ
jgi:flagellar basal-body rod modification protein FlgD